MFLKSSYEDGTRMPDSYANFGVAGGENLSPPFSWGDFPANTQSFALAMVDRHPVAHDFVHWLVIDLPVAVNSLAEGASTAGSLPSGAKELLTTYGRAGYGGPRPPAGTGDHGYETTIYALAVATLDLIQQADYQAFLMAVQGQVLADAAQTGVYSR